MYNILYQWEKNSCPVCNYSLRPVHLGLPLKNNKNAATIIKQVNLCKKCNLIFQNRNKIYLYNLTIDSGEIRTLSARTLIKEKEPMVNKNPFNKDVVEEMKNSNLEFYRKIRQKNKKAEKTPTILMGNMAFQREICFACGLPIAGNGHCGCS